MFLPKRFSLTIVAFSLMLLGASAANGQTGTVATWNIASPYGIAEDRIPRIAEAIGRLDPDVIVLQGVQPHSVASDIQNRLIGYELYILPQTSKQNIAFLSKKSVSVEELRLVSASNSANPTLPKALAAKVRMAQFEFLLIGVQMTRDSAFNARGIRRKTASAIATFIERESKDSDAVLVVGDYGGDGRWEQIDFEVQNPGPRRPERFRYLSSEPGIGRISTIRCQEDGRYYGEHHQGFAVSKRTSQYVERSFKILDWRDAVFELATGTPTCEQFLDSFTLHLPLIAKFEIGSANQAQIPRPPPNIRNVIHAALPVLPEADVATLANFDRLPKTKQIEQLDQHGPLLPRTYNLNQFSMRVFLKGGWKLAIGYSLDTSALITITANEKEFSWRLSRGSGEWPILIPKEFSSVPEPAKLSIVTEGSSGIFRLNFIGVLPDESPAQMPQRNAGAADLYHRLAFKDTSSVLLTQIPDKFEIFRFEPLRGPILTSRGIAAPYNFTLLAEYSGVVAEFCLIKRNPNGALYPETVFSREFVRPDHKPIEVNKPIRDQFYYPPWDGKNKNGTYSYGLHTLTVKAWQGYKRGGRWFGPSLGPTIAVER